MRGAACVLLVLVVLTGIVPAGGAQQETEGHDGVFAVWDRPMPGNLYITDRHVTPLPTTETFVVGPLDEVRVDAVSTHGEIVSVEFCYHGNLSTYCHPDTEAPWTSSALVLNRTVHPEARLATTGGFMLSAKVIDETGAEEWIYQNVIHIG